MTISGHLVLVGMMGAGKTAVGAICAQQLGRSLVDTDELVEEMAGVSVASIFREQGEPVFRRLEEDALRRACGAGEASVIACGGGAVVSEENRRTLAGCGVVVWLRAEPETLAARVGDAATRPLLAGADVPLTLARIATERRAAYDAVADAVVVTDGRTPDEVAGAVLEAFGAAT